MTDPISNLVRNTISTVQRLTSQVSQPAPTAPANATPQVQQAYEQDRFQEGARIVGSVVAGVLGMAPPVVGGAPPISTVEGLETIEWEVPNPALEPLQRFLQTAIDPQTGQPYLGAVDGYGYFSTGTSNALAAFQRDQGLEPTGRINAETLAALQDPRPPVDPMMDRALGAAPENFGAPRGNAYPTSEGLRQDFDGGYMIRDEQRNVTFMSYDGQVLGQVAAEPDPRTQEPETQFYFPQGGGSAWADRQLGTDPTLTIADAGCAMTSAAMCISMALGQELTPEALDQLLDDHGGYAESLLRWEVAASTTGTQVESAYYSHDDLNAWMNANPGVPVAIQVMVSEPKRDEYGNPMLNPDGTPQMKEPWPHWIVITHAEEGPNGETIYYARDPAVADGDGEATQIQLTIDANDQLTTVAPWGHEAVTYSTTPETGMRQFFPADSGS